MVWPIPSSFVHSSHPLTVLTDGLSALSCADPAWKGKELAVFKWNFGGTEVVAVKPVDSDGNVMEDLEVSTTLCYSFWLYDRVRAESF